MKKTCLTFVLIYLGALVVVSVGTFLWNPIPAGASDGQLSVTEARLGASLLLGAVTAVPLTLAIAGLLGVASTMKEWQLVTDALAGSPPKEGRRMAAVGTLRAAASLLQAPLSHRECAIYHYEILFPTKGTSGPNLGYWGFALAPCRVVSALGSVRLLAYSDLDFPADELGAAGLPNATRHLEATASTAADIDVLTGSGLREFKQLFADDDGRIDADFRLAVPGLSLEGCYFRERVVANGDEVCAFGYYSSSHGGFVPRPGCREIYPVRILKGAPSKVARRLRNTAIRSGLGAILFLAMAAGVFVAALYATRG